MVVNGINGYGQSGSDAAREMLWGGSPANGGCCSLVLCGSEASPPEEPYTCLETTIRGEKFDSIVELDLTSGRIYPPVISYLTCEEIM